MLRCARGTARAVVPPFARRIPRVNQPLLGCGVKSRLNRIAGRQMVRHRLFLIALLIAVALVAVLGARHAVSPAAAQFGAIFGGPPRPPADIPQSGPPSSDDRFFQSPPQQQMWTREPQVVAPPPGGYPPPPGYPQQQG